MRVVAGRFGGRRLRAPPGKATRPTTEQVREALFNVLGAAVRDARVLDLYAGSGSLGIEALSRGARQAVFVEAAATAADVLRQNLASIDALHEGTAKVVQRRIEQSIPLLKSMGPFDLVLVDPPFAMVRDRAALVALERLVAGDVIGPASLLILEFPSDQADPRIQGLALDEVRAYGDTRLAFYARQAETPHNALGD